MHRSDLTSCFENDRNSIYINAEHVLVLLKPNKNCVFLADPQITVVESIKIIVVGERTEANLEKMIDSTDDPDLGNRLLLNYSAQDDIFVEIKDQDFQKYLEKNSYKQLLIEIVLTNDGLSYTMTSSSTHITSPEYDDALI